MTSSRRLKDPLLVRMLPGLLYSVAALTLASSVLVGVPVLEQVTDFLLTWVVPLPVLDWFSAIVTFILAAGMERRKRTAWRILVFLVGLHAVLLALTLPTLLLADLAAEAEEYDPLVVYVLGENLLLVVVLLAGLLFYHKRYTVRSQPGNFRRAALAFLLLAGTVTAIALAVKGLLDGFGTEQLLALLTGEGPQGWLTSLLGLGWALAFILAFWMLLRSQKEDARINLEEELRVRELLAAHPQDSLGYFATRRDKSVLLNEHGGVAYRVSLGVALASGDPLGEPATWVASARSFLHHAAAYGWTPAVVGTSEAGARAYVEAGLRALQIGDEAVLRSATFRLDALPEVCRAVRHLSRMGYTVRIRRHRSIPAEELARLSTLAGSWLAGEPERGFSMALGRLADPADGYCVMVEALFPPQDPRGEVAALLSFAPWGADGLSLDVMRRHPQADNGVNELMVSSLMAQGRELGVSQVSLNFAVFRSAFTEGARLGAGPIQRLWRRLLLLASRWWQLESLYRSNAKYAPEWVPRLVCYHDAGDLAQVALATGVAEGFVTVPRWCAPEQTAQPRRCEECSARLLAATVGAVKARAATGPCRSRQQEARLACRAHMLEQGLAPYPASVPVDACCAQAVGGCTVAGRVLAVRDHGGVVFADLRDWSGDLQVLLETSRAGNQAVTRFRRLVRAGDQVAATGTVAASRTGTRSLLVDSWQMTSKALLPLPDKRRGVRDPEARVRQRHLSLITSQRQRQMLVARSQAVQAVRRTLLERGYLEVETPILQAVHGGANARPFRTHVNALDLDLYLRIAPELYLKRLMVGGLDRVFEIGRNFRNEGADATHNPEFTMLEAYQSYGDYHTMKDVVRDLTIAAAQAALGTTVVRGQVDGVEHEIDLAAPWHSVTVCDAVSTGLGEPVGTSTPVEKLRAHASRLGISCDPRWGWGELVQELYEHLAEGTTVGPTFFTDFPAQTSPLTRPHRQDPVLAERWDLIVFGAEVGTAYSELVDPVIQRERLTAQSLAAADGDPEAMELDESFLQALEQGMPPTGGLGVGLDRLVMMLTGASIRETITFPLVRPQR
ncbi:bifunctional lysylphosphatidylglycerol synthetase/lysine--tRNA ligase LysX [Actinomyces trachealis]|uniref:bifunctional lysylphosphatidylglycerol synthetase/lysine--tRNA ligase LysX n=1 Tax=Actinomyces trachealis TaxID=2763540 RepID=UPI001FCFF265|nr:bifunctional lysylphosphatidylglycerol synthetase/lysine--tRNA ligase LysX [Actinomyces trachealis]